MLFSSSYSLMFSWVWKLMFSCICVYFVIFCRFVWCCCIILRSFSVVICLKIFFVLHLTLSIDSTVLLLWLEFADVWFVILCDSCFVFEVFSVILQYLLWGPPPIWRISRSCFIRFNFVIFVIFLFDFFFVDLRLKFCRGFPGFV